MASNDDIYNVVTGIAFPVLGCLLIILLSPILMPALFAYAMGRAFGGEKRGQQALVVVLTFAMAVIVAIAAMQAIADPIGTWLFSNSPVRP